MRSYFPIHDESGGIDVKATDYVKLQTEQAFGLLKIAADGMDDAQYNLDGPGTSNAAAKSHVHALTAFDFFVMNRAKGSDMLWPQFAVTHGLPANSLEIWGHGGVIAGAAIKEFAEQMQKATLDYIATLSDADLDREVDTQFFGKQSLAYVLQLAAMHCAGHAGDVAAVKGSQGLKGLPF
jgi:DinB superfamily